MSKLSTRLARLEVASASRSGGVPVAVVESPFPIGDPQEWALDILERLGQGAAVWVLEGDGFNVLLPPTNAFDDAPGGAMPRDSEAERLWMDAGRTYPHFQIIGGNDGALIVERIESEAHAQQRLGELQDELREA